jgi:hypothetical protein
MRRLPTLIASFRLAPAISDQGGAQKPGISGEGILLGPIWRKTMLNSLIRIVTVAALVTWFASPVVAQAPGDCGTSKT